MPAPQSHQMNSCTTPEIQAFSCVVAPRLGRDSLLPNAYLLERPTSRQGLGSSNKLLIDDRADRECQDAQSFARSTFFKTKFQPCSAQVFGAARSEPGKFCKKESGVLSVLSDCKTHKHTVSSSSLLLLAVAGTFDVESRVLEHPLSDPWKTRFCSKRCAR